MAEVKSGCVLKLTGSIFPSWQRRFVQYQHGKISLRHTDRERMARVLEVSSIRIKPSMPSEMNIVCNNGKSLQFRFASPAERDEWFKAIHDDMSGQEGKRAVSHVPLSPPPQGPINSSQPHLVQAYQPADLVSRQPRDVEMSLSPKAVGRQDILRSPVSEIVAPSQSAPLSFTKSGTPMEPPQSLISRSLYDLRAQAYPGGKYVGEYFSSERSGFGKFEYNDGNVYIGMWVKDQKHGFGRLQWSNGNVFSGEWRGDEMSGYGVFQYANKNEYKGEFQKSIKAGKGRFVWSNGDSYDGEWKNDMMDGRGLITYNNGNVFEGQSKSNLKHGLGKMKWSTGEMYEGEWRNGLLHGQGSFMYANGGSYVGEWVEDMRSGSGTMTHPNGDIYTGAWKNDMREGSGTCRHANGDIFVGNFHQNLRHGAGVYTAAPQAGESKGDEFSGEWMQDKKHGFGRYTWADGDVYEGEWKDDMRNGHGTCSYSNRDEYVGSWVNDQRHGWGRLAWADGNTYEGLWKNDNIAPGARGVIPSRARTADRPVAEHEVNRRQFVSLMQENPPVVSSTRRMRQVDPTAALIADVNTAMGSLFGNFNQQQPSKLPPRELSKKPLLLF